MFYINRNLSHSFFKRFKAWYFFRNSNVVIGNNVSIFGLSYSVEIGSNVNFYNNVIIELGTNSVLQIGDNCLFSYGALLAVKNKISIGSNVQVGEYTSIRDTTHRYDRLDVPMKIAGDTSKPIIIGNDVWIGRGCMILPGAVIENGVVIGANSVVRGHLFANKIYGGVPVKFIKDR